MHIRAVRRAAAGLILGLLPMLAVAACDTGPKKQFPGAFPDSDTDVSAEQAFRDFDIEVPASAKVVGYFATSSDDTYPMAAVLRMPCSAVTGFMAGDGFRKTTSVDQDVVAAEVFAKDHGWSDSDTDDRYVRSEGGSGPIGVVVHRSGTECKVYLFT
ncbi:hypothetical protein [Streptomyces sp. NPDC001410]|uniref:hypothetical protein n=1 Tax=Streptomyces sp. NPDC001410 TaxID=3364574 RepID=UPI0036813D83